MLTSAALTFVAHIPASAAPADRTYTVVEVKSERALDGKMDERMSHTLVLEQGSQRFTVRVRGEVHPSTNRSAHAIRRGNRVALTGRSNPADGVIERSDLRLVR